MIAAIVLAAQVTGSVDVRDVFAKPTGAFEYSVRYGRLDEADFKRSPGFVQKVTCRVGKPCGVVFECDAGATISVGRETKTFACEPDAVTPPPTLVPRRPAVP